MVDFEKLNAMISEINNVIGDVETETIRMNHDVEQIKKNKFIEVNKILINYYKIYTESIGGMYSNCDLKMGIPLGAGHIKFHRQGIYVHLNCDEDKRNPSYNDYSICCDDNDERIKFRYKDYNKSHPSIQWFTSLAMVWDKFENEFDKVFTEQIHDILKQRSEIAHEKYDIAQHNLERYQNLI